MWIKIDGVSNLPSVGERVAIYVPKHDNVFMAALTRRPFLFWQGDGDRNFPLEAASHYHKVKKPQGTKNAFHSEEISEKV
jgi:hypothetical protein